MTSPTREVIIGALAVPEQVGSEQSLHPQSLRVTCEVMDSLGGGDAVSGDAHVLAHVPGARGHV